MKKLLFILLLLFYSNVCLAQTTTSTTGTFSLVKKNDIALFDGILFDVYAVSILIVDKELNENQFKLKLDYELSKLDNHYSLKIGDLQLSFDTYKNTVEEIITIKDKENKELREIALSKKDNTILYISIGVLRGIVLTLLTSYTINKVR